MTELEPDFLQVSVGEIRQHIIIDGIFRERGRVLAKANPFQPSIHAVGHTYRSISSSLPV